MFPAKRLVLGLCLAGIAGTASAQLVENLDWKETEAPPPPAFDQNRAMPIEMPPYMSLKFGVDPATIVITGDGVVRYVVVATSRAGGAVNAFYEGIRCATEEVKTYARYGGDGWQAVNDPEWKRISDRNSRYASALFTQALCRGHAPRATVGEIMRQLKNPIREVE
ncbi:CNP1-like family protein [Burkholderiales bacterium 8X]|nr:CNP1-like family protein [Burkholderiales bacterium 8X]